MQVVTPNPRRSEQCDRPIDMVDTRIMTDLGKRSAPLGARGDAPSAGAPCDSSMRASRRMT